MNVLIVSGSHRVESESGRIAQLVKQILLEDLKLANDATVLDLGKTPLPLWSEKLFTEGSEKEQWAPWVQAADACDALVVISPEWNGMVPPALKNFFLTLSTSGKPLAHKPGYIISTSAGINGAYPIQELRGSGYKNLCLNYIPEHLILRGVSTKMKTWGQPADDNDKALQERLVYGLRLLQKYAEGLKVVRESGLVDHSSYPNGM